jgi:hypothetical protein
VVGLVWGGWVGLRVCVRAWTWSRRGGGKGLRVNPPQKKGGGGGCVLLGALCRKWLQLCFSSLSLAALAQSCSVTLAPRRPIGVRCQTPGLKASSAPGDRARYPAPPLQLQAPQHTLAKPRTTLLDQLEVPCCRPAPLRWTSRPFRPLRNRHPSSAATNFSSPLHSRPQ